VPWSAPFHDPIQPLKGKPLLTLKDVADYITKLQETEQQHPAWQTAIEALILVAETSGATSTARVYDSVGFARSWRAAVRAHPGEDLFMLPAILGIVLGTQLLVQVSDHVPNLHAERTCKGRIAGFKLMRMEIRHTYEDCMGDEKLALQNLEPIWSSYSASIRAQCTSDTIELGVNSYVDLLACLQATDSRGPQKSR
jgi:hypothetical protein